MRNGLSHYRRLIMMTNGLSHHHRLIMMINDFSHRHRLIIMTNDFSHCHWLIVMTNAFSRRHRLTMMMTDLFHRHPLMTLMNDFCLAVICWSWCWVRSVDTTTAVHWQHQVCVYTQQDSFASASNSCQSSGEEKRSCVRRQLSLFAVDGNCPLAGRGLIIISVLIAERRLSLRCW